MEFIHRLDGTCDFLFRLFKIYFLGCEGSNLVITTRAFGRGGKVKNPFCSILRSASNGAMTFRLSLKSRQFSLSQIIAATLVRIKDLAWLQYLSPSPILQG